jgi:hypothetical protein
MTKDVPSPWFIVLYEWQGCQGMTTDAAWWPSADILGAEEGALATIERLHRGEQPRRGQLTYRNIRGPFPWFEKPNAAEPGVQRKPMLSDLGDELIRELHRQNLVSMRAEFDGAVLRIEPASNVMIVKMFPEPGEASSPADLVGALQDVVHTDPGPVRAGHAVREASSPCPSVHDHMWAEDGHCMRCYAVKSSAGE